MENFKTYSVIFENDHNAIWFYRLQEGYRCRVSKWLSRYGKYSFVQNLIVLKNHFFPEVPEHYYIGNDSYRISR